MWGVKMKNLVITGDSLSYNRYDYLEDARTNAWDCPVGMGSWSFRMCQLFLSTAKGFKYADELNFDEQAISGIGEEFDPMDSVFGERVRTVIPKDDKIRFVAESDNETIVLYLQKRPRNYCRFSISVDGICHSERIDTYGDNSFYRGWSVLPVELTCDKNKKQHEIILSQFEYADDKPMVTIAGVSVEPRHSVVTGQGCRTAKFINFHFEQRIAAYSPDALVLIFGGNDVLYYSPEEYRENLEIFFKTMKARFPQCKLITVTIPPSALYTGLTNGVKYTSQKDWDENQAKYNNIMIEVSQKYGAQTVVTEELFSGIPTEKWRFDDVHMKRFGNDLLFEKVKEILFS